MKKLLGIISVLVLFGGSAFTQAGTSTNDIMSFADHLYSQKDYYRAITEYKRFIFLNPSDSMAATAEYQIGMSYMNGDKLENAVQVFSDLADRRAKDVIGRKALLMAAESYSKMKQYREAQYALEKLLTRYPDDRENDLVRLKIGWYLMCLGESELALDKFKGVPASSSFREQSERLAKQVAAYDGISLKSPVLAGGLSAVLPGAGQLYAGRPRDALVAFLINGGLIWAAVEAFDKKQDFAGSMFAFLDLSWYAGNIYNAVNSANKINRSRRQEFMNDVEIKCGLTLARGERDSVVPALALKVSF